MSQNYSVSVNASSATVSAAHDFYNLIIKSVTKQHIFTVGGLLLPHPLYIPSHVFEILNSSLDESLTIGRLAFAYGVSWFT
jgi:hypothetical protein